MTRVMVVDKIASSHRSFSLLLEDEGYETLICSHASQVFEAIDLGIAGQLALLLDDPDLQAIRLMTEMKRHGFDQSVIIISSKGSVEDKVEAFQQGVDDYITRPFEFAELIARVHAVIRRTQLINRSCQGSVLSVGAAVLSLHTLKYRLHGYEPVLLTPTEMRILATLMREHHKVISRPDLIQEIWGFDLHDTNRVDVYIRRIRRKIEPDPQNPVYLQAVRGWGYVYTTNGTSAMAESELASTL